MMKTTSQDNTERILLESRLRSHLRCPEEDATNPDLSQLDRLALVRERAKRIREIEAKLEENARTEEAHSQGR